MRDDEALDVAVPVVTSSGPTRHLCLGCRLIQTATGQCVQCGGTTIAPVELVRELLAYRDLSLAGERDLGMITALVAGSTFIFPILWPVAVASLGALVVRVPVRRWRDRDRIANPVAGIVVPPPHPPGDAVLKRGTVRRFRGEVRPSIWDDAPVLVEEIAIDAPEGGVLVRHARAAPFLFEGDDHLPVLVRGPVRLVPVPAWTEGARKIKPGDPLLAGLGLPTDLRVRGIAHRTRLVEGMAVTIAVSRAGIGEEAIAEYAGLRDGGVTRVFRGVAGEPVLLGATFGAGSA